MSDNFFLDSHCHLQMEEFSEEYNSILNNCINNNVKLLCNIGYDIESSIDLLELKFPQEILNYNFAGIHPHYVKNIDSSETDRLIELLQTGKYKGVGEIGIDRYWYKDEKIINKQKSFFIKQMNIAKEYNMPIVLHIRNAYKDIIDILRREEYKRFNFHSFTGNENELKFIIDNNYFFGINGIITFKNSNLKHIIKKEYVKNMLIETDAPYLAPVPKRGKRNKPYYVKYVYEFIADLFNMKIDELQKIVFENFQRFINEN